MPLTLRTISSLFPGGYFINTRLTNRKAIGFHGCMEWIPAVLLVYVSGTAHDLYYLVVYYIAFLSVYEVGYFANDWQARSESEGRKRSETFSVWYTALFTGIRLSVFSGIAYYTQNQNAVLWWSWFVGLAVIFTSHNLLRLASLKVVTFMGLAFFRFFSPLVFLLPQGVFTVLVFPVFVCYVIYRTLIYADSKNLFHGFERKSLRFRAGYYVVLLPLLGVLAFHQSSHYPVAVCGYFLVANLGLSAAEKLLSGDRHSSN